MPVRLTICPPRSDTPRVVEFDDSSVSIGRSSSCDIRLPFRAVSGHHLTLIQSSDGLYVRDEASTNGTLLDGEPLDSGVEHKISWGATLAIVDLSIEVEMIPDLDLGVSLEHTGTLARQMLGEALLDSAADEELESAHFEVIAGAAAGQIFELPDYLDRGRIAADADALIRLDGLSDAFEIYRDGDGFGLRPTQESPSHAPATVNGAALLDERRLTSGDTIASGSVELRFVDPLEAYLDELDGVIAPPAADGNIDTGPPDEEYVPQQTAPVDAEPPETQNPDSARRSLSALEVGVIAVSVVVLAGVAFLLLMILGVF